MDRYSSILIFIPFSLNEINKEEKHVYVCTLLLQKFPPPIYNFRGANGQVNVILGAK